MQNIRRNMLSGLLTGLIGLAWLTLWVWGQSPGGRYLNHAHLAEIGLEQAGFALLFIGGWTLMTVAMMLPTSLPLIRLFVRLTATRPDKAVLLYLLLAGYLVVWVGFGLLAHLADWLLHRLAANSHWLASNTWLIEAGLLGLAGVYQFTPLKYKCLEECRSPISFIMARWTGRDRRRAAWRLGLEHGWFCLGCCWSLMLLMFAVGTGNLGWMLALAALMAVEKNLSSGRRFSQAVGLVLVGWSFFTLAVSL